MGKTALVSKFENKTNLKTKSFFWKKVLLVEQLFYRKNFFLEKLPKEPSSERTKLLEEIFFFKLVLFSNFGTRAVLLVHLIAGCT